MMRRAVAMLAGLAGLLGAPVVYIVAAAEPASAAVIVVSTTTDGVPGSLRQAIADATTAGGDEIQLQAGQTYTLTCAAGGDLDHGNTPLRMTGNAATITMENTCGERILEHGTGLLEFVNLTISGGQQTAAAPASGGAVLAGGPVTVTASTFSDNAVTTNGAGNQATGGAISAGGAVGVTNSTFSANVALANDGTAAGGAIDASGSLSITGSTFQDNQALTGGTNHSVAGGAVSGGGVTVVGSTFSGNTAHAVDGFAGGGAINSNGAGSMTSSTLVDNTVVSDSSFAAGGGANFNGGGTATGNIVTGNHAISVGFATGGGINSNGNLTMSDSEISGNEAGSQASFARGGAINTNGALVLTRSTIRDNTAFSNSADVSGGGTHSNGSATIVESTFSDNTLAAVVNAHGGGVSATADASLTNSTVTMNTASAAGGAEGDGGGVVASDIVLVYATVVENSAPTGANLEILVFDSLESFGSVVALPQGGGENCDFQAPPVTISHGFNFADDTSCGFTNTAQGDRENAGVPGLGALADNGGSTQTRLPSPTSPLLNFIPLDACQADGAAGVTTDQRRVSRPQGPGCEIGAVEVVVPEPVFTG